MLCLWLVKNSFSGTVRRGACGISNMPIFLAYANFGVKKVEIKKFKLKNTF